MEIELTRALIEDVARVIEANKQALTELDQAIGDGDHGVNMARGAAELMAQKDVLADLPLGKALEKAGMAMLMKVGGASGPLYASLLIDMGKAVPTGAMDVQAAGRMLEAGIAAVMKRGKSTTGEKTMLEVLVPVRDRLLAASGPAGLAAALKRAADEGLESTRPLRATKGRAAFLGERSVGQLDPGASSARLIVHAVVDRLAQAGVIS